MGPVVQDDARMRHIGLGRQGLGSLRFCQQSPVLSSLSHRAPTRSPESHGYPRAAPGVFPVSSCSNNGLGAEGATALLSGLSALTKLQSIDVR